MKLDLSSAPMSLIFSGPDLASLSLDPFWVTEDSLEEDGGSGLPICEHVCAKRAKGLFLASSLKETGREKTVSKKKYIYIYHKGTDTDTGATVLVGYALRINLSREEFLAALPNRKKESVYTG